MPSHGSAAAAALLLLTSAWSGLGTVPARAQDREQQKQGVKDPPPKLSVEDGLFVTVPDGAVIGAFTITNNDGHPHMITGFSSAACGQLHLEQWDGSAPNPGPLELTVPAKNKMVFLRGGYHLHCEHPTHPLQVGDTVPVSMSFEKLAPVNATFHVRRYTGPGSGAHRRADAVQNR